MSIAFLEDIFRNAGQGEAIVWKDQYYTYSDLLERLQSHRQSIAQAGISEGSVVALEADFSPNSIALMLALIGRNCILVPLTSSVETKKSEFKAIAEVEWSVKLNPEDDFTVTREMREATHQHYLTLRERGHSGLVLFSSGSTGKSKAAIHDMTGILEKFQVRRQTLRTITFLLYDHIGGVNTLLYVLSNAGCVVTVDDRSPDNVLRSIARHRVELLPTSPTFINLILLSEAHMRHAVPTLKIVTYGTEPMPATTLSRFHELFPAVRLQQTYGLSEVGILRSKSKSSDSLWVKIGGEGFQTRVVDGILQIKARSAMLGYLNAPSPFTEDGWFNTGDQVDVDGDYFLIRGRKSEIINVGGEKVYPTEVESAIQSLENISEVTVFGETNPITGNIVCARVRLKAPEDLEKLTARIKLHCRKVLQPYKVPVKIWIDEERQFSERFKKIRVSQI